MTARRHELTFKTTTETFRNHSQADMLLKFWHYAKHIKDFIKGSQKQAMSYILQHNST
jgi:hypothetical protein